MSESKEFYYNGYIQDLIDKGASEEEVKAVIELWGHDSGELLPVAQEKIDVNMTEKGDSSG